MTTSTDARRPAEADERARGIAEQRAALEAHQAANSGEALRRKIRRQIADWRQNRVRYPGWLILPTENRHALWSFTQEWLQPVLAEFKQVDAIEGLRWLRELTWRYDLCLLPLFRDHADAITLTLSKVEPFRTVQAATLQPAATSSALTDASVATPADLGHEPVRPTASNLAAHDWTGLAQDWAALACSLLRFHREQGDDERFEQLATRLEQLQPIDVERSTFVTHQRCINALERMEQGRARTLIEQWGDQSRDPFWLVRKAALMAEIGDARCGEVVRRALSAIREVPSKADEDNFAALSREGWALYAFNVIGQYSGQPRPDLAPRLEALAAARCDPHDVIKPIVAILEPRPTKASVSAKTSRFGALPQSLQAYQARRLVDEAGYPMRFDHTVAASEVIQRAVPWIGTVSERDALQTLLRVVDPRYIDEHLSPERIGRLAYDDVARTVRLALAAAVQNATSLTRPVLRSGSKPTGVLRPDADTLRRDTVERHVNAALKVLSALAPRVADDMLDEVCDGLLAVGAGWSSGPWQVRDTLRSTLQSCLAEMSPEQAAKHLLAVTALPLVGLDMAMSPATQWYDDAVFALWDAASPADKNDARWRAQVRRLVGALGSGQQEITRAHAMLRLVVLHRSDVLLPNERHELARVVWQASDEGAIQSAAPGGEAEAQLTPSLPRANFPLPVRFLLTLPELRSGDATSAVKRIVLARPLPRFSETAHGGGKTNWNFGKRPETDPLTDLLVATRKPWRHPEDETPTIDWTTADATVLVDRMEAWWNEEGRALWREVQSDHGPFNAIMPRWRFETIVDVLAFVVLTARGPDRSHLARASNLIRGMRDEGVSVELALPTLAAENPASGVEVARTLRLSLASRDPIRSAAAISAVFVWLDAAQQGGIEHPPRDLLMEIASIVRARRGPALGVALQLATVLLRQGPDDKTPAMLDDIGIGLQYLAVETRYPAGVSDVGEGVSAAAMRRYASDLLAAYAPHVPANDETLRVWLAEAEDEPMRSVRATLVRVRDETRKRS